VRVRVPPPALCLSLLSREKAGHHAPAPASQAWHHPHLKLVTGGTCRQRWLLDLSNGYPALPKLELFARGQWTA
jgi:hypothetical protein